MGFEKDECIEYCRTGKLLCLIFYFLENPTTLETFPSNQFTVRFFIFDLTEFLRKNHGSKIPKCPQLRVKRRAQNTHALHSGKIKNLTEKIFRQTNYLAIFSKNVAFTIFLLDLWKNEKYSHSAH